MNQTSWSESERRALAATLRELGPGAPTLCEGWRSQDLLAHLELRERAPWRIALDAVRRPQPGREPRQSALAAQASEPAGFARLVDSFESAAGRRPIRLLKDRANLVEYVVHHEDLRRAGTEPAPPRELPVGMHAALLERLGTMARLALRRSPCGVVLVESVSRRRLVVKRASDSVAVVGSAVELALAVTGRVGHADIDLTGSPEQVAALRAVLAG